jgi:hypothetical protein
LLRAFVHTNLEDPGSELLYLNCPTACRSRSLQASGVPAAASPSSSWRPPFNRSDLPESHPKLDAGIHRCTYRVQNQADTIDAVYIYDVHSRELLMILSSLACEYGYEPLGKYFSVFDFSEVYKGKIHECVKQRLLRSSSLKLLTRVLNVLSLMSTKPVIFVSSSPAVTSNCTMRVFLIPRNLLICGNASRKQQAVVVFLLDTYKSHLSF